MANSSYSIIAVHQNWWIHWSDCWARIWQQWRTRKRPSVMNSFDAAKPHTRTKYLLSILQFLTFCSLSSIPHCLFRSAEWFGQMDHFFFLLVGCGHKQLINWLAHPLTFYWCGVSGGWLTPGQHVGLVELGDCASSWDPLIATPSWGITFYVYEQEQEQAESTSYPSKKLKRILILVGLLRNTFLVIMILVEQPGANRSTKSSLPFLVIIHRLP